MHQRFAILLSALLHLTGMKIALVHIRLLNRGGLERRLFNYIEWFRSRGHEVHVFVYKVEEEKIPDGIHLHVVPVRWVPKPFRAFFFDRRLRRILPSNQFDFILSLGRTSFQDAVLIPANHLGYLNAMHKTRKGISDRLQIYMDRKAYAAPGMLFPCSEMMKAEAISLYGVPAQKCTVLYPPINTTLFNPRVKESKAELRSKYGFADGKKSFVFVSASHGRKGLPLLLEAFARLQDKNVELLVAGPAPVPGNHPNVRYLGFVSQVEELYAAADFTLLPAHYEPFGQVVAESILCGTPVLVSGSVGAQSVVTPRTGLVIQSFSSDAWAAAIAAAADTVFEMDPAFGETFGLAIDHHMMKMLAACGKTGF